jgi:hypothetical protein
VVVDEPPLDDAAALGDGPALDRIGFGGVLLGAGAVLVGAAAVTALALPRVSPERKQHTSNSPKTLQAERRTNTIHIVGASLAQRMRPAVKNRFGTAAPIPRPSFTKLALHNLFGAKMR